MDKHALLYTGQVLVAMGLVTSLMITAHYHVNIQSFYNNHPDALERDTAIVENYLKRNGCTSKNSLFLDTGFGYLQAWEILHRLTENREAYLKGNGKICLNPYKYQVTSPG